MILSQYVSLALYLQGPPHFLPRGKEEDLPPDAARWRRSAPCWSASTRRPGCIRSGSGIARTMPR